jgi:signal transduction histidine kinase/DNA-binding response OmpR family regulator/ligand-binding sensor domain-containing protein
MRSLFISLFFFISVLANAQNKQSSFVYEYFSTKEGLSHNYVSKVVSDSLNIKWIATENGITKFDGVNFSYIRPNNKYKGLANENVETLFVDSKNNLWIGTKSGGLSKLAINTHQLESYNHVLSNDNKTSFRIKAIEEDDNGNIWVATNNHGIFVIDVILEKTIKNIKASGTRFIKKDSNGNIWFGQNFHLKRYNTHTKKTKKFFIGEFPSSFIEDKKRNCFWVGSINLKDEHHIIKYDCKTETLSKTYTNIPSNFTSSLYIDKLDNLWIGTWGNGLYRSDATVSNFEKLNLVYPPDSKKKVDYEIILDIHKDKNDVIWISSDFGGVVKLTESKGFHNIDAVVKNKALLKGMNFQTLYKDSTEIFLGTLRNGMFYGPNFSNLKQFSSFKKNKIYAIGKHLKTLLISDNNNLLFLDKNKHIIHNIKISQATCFFSYDENTLWVGTQQNGIKILDISNIKNPKLVKHYRTKNKEFSLENNRINSIVKDTNENIWLGTYNGLHLFNKATQQFTPYKQIKGGTIPNIVNTIFTDENFIWLGTPNGLYKLSFQENSLAILDIYNTKENGLENDFICGIKADNDGYLWLSTSTTIIRFDQYNDSFVNYGKQDGIYTSLFNNRTLFSSPDNNTLYAGGTNNLTYFNPETIANDDSIDQLHFLSLKVDNKKVTSFDEIHGKTILTQDFNYTTAFSLSHKEKSFSVSFGTTDFSKNSYLHYRYKLVGYEEEWNYLENQNDINFIGLPAGKYNLQVAASRDYQNWSTPISMKINIDYAPWLSPLAYFGYFLLFILVFGSFSFVLMKQFRLKDRMEKEQELSEAKFTFFTNISHEFRTPLTLILSPLKELIKTNNFEAGLTEKLVTMEKNADRLLNLITQLLDFRKADHGLLELSASQGNFVNFSNEVFLYFKEQARTKEIKYTFISKKSDIQFPFDRNKMEIVLCNLISNALKYTSAGDSIHLEISSDNDFCNIRLKDTGIGMNKEVTTKIFDRFYQIKSTNTSNILGSGIGLSFTKKIIELHSGTIEVTSKINHGTEFIIQIPLVPNTKFNKDLASTNTEKIDNYESIENEHYSNLEVTTKENTLLIVDDNDDIRNYLNQLLKTDYTIITAKDGVEAIETASKEIPDLILCDIMMPRKDGLAVCKELKSQKNTSHIPIILLTARSSNMYEIQGLETGADDFITKPFDPQVIKARISSALQNRSKIREYFLNKVRFEPSVDEHNTTDPESIFIEEAIRLVEDNLENENFDLKTMMDTLHMSQSSLYRKIKSLTGLSLTRFIRSIRLKKAAELILNGNEKLSTVALTVGFNDYTYFRKSFIKQFGCLPSEYKTKKTTSNSSNQNEKS